MINKYKYNNTEFLLYSLSDTIPPLGEHLELIEENIDITADTSNHHLPIANVVNFVLAGSGMKRTEDRKLEQEGISTFYDLQCAYNLLRNKSLDKPTTIRTLVEKKYSEIINQ